MGIMEISILAWITIIIVGFIKEFDPFAKIQKELRRPIYLLIDALLAFGFSAIYFTIFKITFTIAFVTFSIKVLAAVLTLYATYENTKLKDLVKIVKEKILSIICKKTISKKAQELLNALTPVITEAEKSKIEESAAPTIVVEEQK